LAEIRSIASATCTTSFGSITATLKWFTRSLSGRARFLVVCKVGEDLVARPYRTSLSVNVPTTSKAQVVEPSFRGILDMNGI